MKQISVILTAAISLNGNVVSPSDKPVPVDENLAAQLIANGRAKLPELPQGELEKAGRSLNPPSDAEIEAANKRLETANKKADEAENLAEKRIEKANERIGKAEIDASEKIAAHEKSVKEAEEVALEKLQTFDEQVEAAENDAQTKIKAAEQSADAAKTPGKGGDTSQDDKKNQGA